MGLDVDMTKISAETGIVIVSIMTVNDAAMIMGPRAVNETRGNRCAIPVLLHPGMIGTGILAGMIAPVMSAGENVSAR